MTGPLSLFDDILLIVPLPGVSAEVQDLLVPGVQRDAGPVQPRANLRDNPQAHFDAENTPVHVPNAC